MSALLQGAVDTVNSIAGTGFTVFSSFITFNYHVGDVIFSCLQYLCSICSSILISLFLAVKIMLEDLVVFLQEIFEGVSSVLVALETCISFAVDFVVGIFSSIGCGLFGIGQSVATTASLCWNSFLNCVANIRFFFDLLGRSIILLFNLLPRTVYIAYISSGLLLERLAATAVTSWAGLKEAITSASPELLLGMAVGLTSSLLLLRLSARVIRERNVSWESASLWLLREVCRAYVLFIRLVARIVGLVFTMVEMTISHLRVPMFAHAGDSDDEDEDRENLVGEVEDEDEEEVARAETKKRNYRLVLERAGRRRGSSDSGGAAAEGDGAGEGGQAVRGLPGPGEVHHDPALQAPLHL